MNYLIKSFTDFLIHKGHELFSKEMAGLEWSENTKDKFEVAQKCYVKEFNKLEAFSKDVRVMFTPCSCDVYALFL